MNAFHMLFYLADFCHFFVTIFLPKLCLIFHIKVAVSRDFLTIFYFMNDESSPPGPLINRLKWFSWKIICCRGYIRMLSSKIWLPPQGKARRGLQIQNWCRQNSAQCWPVRSLTTPTPRSVSQFWIFGKVLDIFWKINIWTLDSLEMEMFKSKKISLTLRSVSLCEVWLRAVLDCAESNFLQC